MSVRTFLKNNREAVFFFIKFLAALIVFQLLFTEDIFNLKLDLWKHFARWSALVSGGILKLFGMNVVVAGETLSHGQTVVKVSKGCDGLTASAIFIAGVIAFRAGALAKTIGVIGGFIAIQIVNVIRILTLFLTLVYFPQSFEDMHMYVMQAVVIAVSVALWFFWAQKYAEVSRR